MGCRLCENYDFNSALISSLLGDTVISLAAGTRRPTMKERFKYCPECGKELTEENFKPKGVPNEWTKNTKMSR